MPMVCPPYSPAPKSGCSGVESPMKLMIAAELGSTGALVISRFHALSLGKGRNPLRLAPRPRLMLLQVWAWDESDKKTKYTRRVRNWKRRMGNTSRRLCWGRIALLGDSEESRRFTHRTVAEQLR